MSINWDDLVKDADLSGGGGGGAREPLPIGDYPLKVIEVTEKTTSTGKTMFSVKTEVQEGTYKGQWVWDNLTISPESPKAMGFFFRKMAALGLPKEFFAAKPATSQVTQAMQNRSFIGTVKQETYQGTVRNKIDAYSPAGGGAGPAFQAAPGAPAAPPVPQTAAAPVAPPAPAPAQPPVQAPQQGSQIGNPGPSQIGQTPPAPAADPWSNNSAPAVGEAWPAQGQEASGNFAPPPPPPF